MGEISPKVLGAPSPGRFPRGDFAGDAPGDGGWEHSQGLSGRARVRSIADGVSDQRTLESKRWPGRAGLTLSHAGDDIGDIVLRQLALGVGADLAAMPQDGVGVGDLVHVANVVADENNR